jgi:tetratricopeptide (TPR) repeat protein
MYEIENRLLVPNWRDFKRTIIIGELGILDKSREQVLDNSKIKFDWKNNKTIGVAADLINNSFVSNDLYSVELQEAIAFIEKKKSEASKPLLSLISGIKKELNPVLADSNKILEKNIDSINEFKALSDDKLLNKIISKTKKLTKDYLSNSIYWIELARLYTIKNQLEKANKCILIGLNLAPDNRFVLRSAVRFFIHTKQEDKAIYYLRKSNFIKDDPWLISAHIASSKIIGRYSPFIKNGINLITSKNYSNFDLTELSSSIGTLELESGSFKKSKNYLDLSISSPNDNSLAQFEWLSNKEKRLTFNPSQFGQVKNPFEAFAYKDLQRGQFEASFYNCINWYLDIPFTKRPLMLGSYLAILIEDYEASIILCLIGLRSSKNEIGFINNIIFALCMKGSFDEIPKYFPLINKSLLNSATDEEKITIQATIGLYYMRIGNTEEGKSFYKEAIKNSEKISNKYYYKLAVINYTRELFRTNDPDFTELKSLFKSIESNDADVIFQREKVLNLIKTNAK